MNALDITLARPLDPRVKLAKRVHIDPLADWPHIVAVEPSPQATRHCFRVERITDLASLAGILRRADAAGEIVVRGEPIEPIGRRAIYGDPEKGPAGLRVVPRQWCAFDWDNVPLQLELAEPVDPAIRDDPAEWHNWAEPDPLLDPEVGARIVLQRLPHAFRDRDCIVQVSASAGFKPGFRLRTWHLLDRAITGDDLKTWCRPAIDRGLLDPVTLVETQPHYVSCTFVGGTDPCPARFVVLRQGGEVVPVADIEVIRERQRQRHKALIRSSLPPGKPPEGAAEAAIERCVEAIRGAAEKSRHPTYLEHSARARAICERAGIAWEPVRTRLEAAYLSTLTPQEAAQRRRGSTEGVMRWLDRRASA